LVSTVHLTREGLRQDIGLFPTVGRDGFGLRPGAVVELVGATDRGVRLVVRLPGWDRIDLFDDQDDAASELAVALPWSALTNPVGLTVSDVAAAVRERFGWDAYTAAFQL
jgi:hypothetical protein